VQDQFFVAKCHAVVRHTAERGRGRSGCRLQVM
jgi:hypothetical protein